MTMPILPFRRKILFREARLPLSWLVATLLLVACGREGTETSKDTRVASASSGASQVAGGPRVTGGPQPGTRLIDAQYVASGTTPFVDGCDGVFSSGSVYPGAEVEPSFAIHPTNPDIMVGLWQQDRWSDGAARGLVSGTSRDGGRSWVKRAHPFSRCGGGTVVNGGNFERATDPWVSYAPNGVVHAMSLSLTGGVFEGGSVNAMLVSRSFDNGLSWTAPIPLIVDGAGAFNDKNALTADPHDANYVYAVWDRLIDANDSGPSYFARTTNGGASWEPARPIHDPGARNQTIGNLIAVLPDGTLVNVFNRIDRPIGGAQTARVAIIRSTDRGATWSAPIYIANLLSIGTRDPHNPGLRVRDGSIIPNIAAGPDGALYVVWQDSRFSGGVVDGIAISRSVDGGFTWSTPTRVNALAGVAAFTPTVHVAADGVVGVSYYDFRNNTATAPLTTEYWLARSNNGGATWTETRVSPPFDLTLAPDAGGLFLGDYQGLASIGSRFVPFYARTGTASGDPTDLVVAPQASLGFGPAPKTAAALRAAIRARQAPAGFRETPALRARVEANLRERLESPPGLAGELRAMSMLRAALGR